jgi:hypothetical protein
MNILTYLNAESYYMHNSFAPFEHSGYYLYHLPSHYKTAFCPVFLAYFTYFEKIGRLMRSPCCLCVYVSPPPSDLLKAERVEPKGTAVTTPYGHIYHMWYDAILVSGPVGTHDHIFVLFRTCRCFEMGPTLRREEGYDYYWSNGGDSSWHSLCPILLLFYNYGSDRKHNNASNNFAVLSLLSLYACVCMCTP